GLDPRYEASPNFDQDSSPINSVADFRTRLLEMYVPVSSYIQLLDGKNHLSVHDSSVASIVFRRDACSWLARGVARVTSGAICLPPELSAVEQHQRLSVSYTIDETSRVSSAVRVLADGTNRHCAVLFIPGSGPNPVSAVLRGDSIY